QYLQQMPIRILEVEPASATMVVDRHVVRRPRPGAVSDAFALDPMKDRVEVRIAHLEGIVMGLECRARVKVQDKRIVHPDGRKVWVRTAASNCSPKMRAKNLADASLSCAGTIVWSSTIGMAISLECSPPTSDARRSLCGTPGVLTP